MRLLNSLVIAILFCSCVTQKRCAERFPPKTSDSIRTWITYSCDSFPVYVPYQELTFDTSGIIPVTVNYHHTKREGALTGSVDINNGKLSFKCAEDSLRAVIEYMAKEFHEKDSREKAVNVPLRDSWYNLWKYLAIFSTVLVGIFLTVLFSVKIPK